MQVIETSQDLSVSIEVPVGVCCGVDVGMVPAGPIPPKWSHLVESPAGDDSIQIRRVYLPKIPSIFSLRYSLSHPTPKNHTSATHCDVEYSETFALLFQNQLVVVDTPCAYLLRPTKKSA